MAESRFNKVCNVLTNYNFDINEDVNNDFVCKICKKIMINPYSGFCGCQYCYLCIKDYIGEDLKHCPGGTEECAEEFLVMERNVIKNLAIRRKIFNMIIKCPNTSCFFRSKLEDIDEHIRICTMTPMECPFGTFGCINEGLREDNVKAHLDLDELKHTRMIVEAINHLKNDVNGLKHILEVKEIEITEMKEEIENNKRQIEDVKEDSKRKEILMKEEIDELKDEIRVLKDNQERIESQSEVMKEEEMELMNNKINELKKINEERNKNDIENYRRKEDIMKEINETKDEMKILKDNEERRDCESKEMIEREMRMIKNEISELKIINEERNLKYIEDCRRKEEMMNEINVIKKEIKELKIINEERNKKEFELIKSDIIKMKENIKEIFEVEIVNVKNNKKKNEEEIKCTMMTKEVCLNIKEDFVWTIKDFNTKINNNKYKEYLSDSFCKDDYKLRLRAKIGDIFGGGLCLSVCIMRGERDDRVKWLMKHTITINIINQDSLKIHKRFTVNYNEYNNKSLFAKPKSNNNKYIHCGDISYRHIKDIRGIIKDDSLAVGCSLSSK